MQEFELIKSNFLPLAAPEGLSLLDDAALLSPPEGFDLVITSDMLVEGVHFRSDDPPATIAWKALAVNLSDLATKGARPWRYFLSLGLKADIGADWVHNFSAGLSVMQSRYGCLLAGGDTTSGGKSLTISITAIGLVPKGEMIRRTGAKIGNQVWVTGVLGRAERAYDRIMSGVILSMEDKSAYQCPIPQVRFGQALRSVATASADISDGLLADLGHICRASGVSARLSLQNIPIESPIESPIEGVISDKARLKALSWGDDYQLVFCAAPENHDRIVELGIELATPVTYVGDIVAGEGVFLLDLRGSPLNIDQPGYIHDIGK